MASLLSPSTLMATMLLLLRFSLSLTVSWSVCFLGILMQRSTLAANNYYNNNKNENENSNYYRVNNNYYNNNKNENEVKKYYYNKDKKQYYENEEYGNYYNVTVAAEEEEEGVENYYYFENNNEDGNEEESYYNQENEEVEDDGYQYVSTLTSQWDGQYVFTKKCIYFKNKDVIVFSFHDEESESSKEDDDGGAVAAYQNARKSVSQCASYATQTNYYTEVSTFVAAWIEQLQSITSSSQQYYDDSNHQSYAAESYMECTPREVNGRGTMYVRVGCSSTSTQAVAVNLYEDSSCTTLSSLGSVPGLDVSTDLQLPFKTCTNCYNGINPEDEERDFYDSSPLCSILKETKQSCNNKCTKMSAVSRLNDGWSPSDKFLLGFLAIFGACLFIGIVLQRQQMTKKEALLEEAAMSVAGLQRVHVIGIVFLYMFVLLIFALLQMKAITWFLLLCTNFALFIYLVKLTATSYGGSNTDSTNNSNGDAANGHGIYPPGLYAGGVGGESAALAGGPRPSYDESEGYKPFDLGNSSYL